MPVTPNFDWEQTSEEVIVRAELKGFKPDAIDVFISDLFAKVNAHPTYLLTLDLLHEIVVESSGFLFRAPHTISMTLMKKTPGVVWETLCVDKKTPAVEIKSRRDESLARAEALYNTKLQTREQQKEVERKRMFNEHWEIERQQRRDIEAKVRAEREAETASLKTWEEEQQSAAAAKNFVSPAQIGIVHHANTPAVRQVETVTVNIDFTPKSMAMPSRTRGDEDFYRKSRYKPVSIEDSPMFWKEKADKLYRARSWKQAADAYSESIKRDGCFQTCVSNRAACWLRLHEYKRAIEDCDLALTLLANTPASETTQERYRATLTRLHARRGAARAWSGDYQRAVEDFRLAHAYRSSEHDTDVALDLHTLENYMKEHGLVESADPTHIAMQEASRHYYNGNYVAAAECYREILKTNEFEVKARNNLCATLLQMEAFQEAFEEAQNVITFCAEVAQALNQPGASTSGPLADSDDEEDGDAQDEMIARRNAAAKKITEKSGHVYLLLKAYVRGAAALCGMKQHRRALELMELAVKITPYDDDLRDDYNRLTEKIRFETLVSASTAKP